VAIERRSRTIVPDYRRPAALMVSHYNSSIRQVLEGIATFAARVIGVVLLSGDPERTRAFVAAQPRPERFSIVTAPFDSPWLRDRSPVAVRTAGSYRWVVTRFPPTDRPLDDVLFPRISRRRLAEVPLVLPQGNLVAGPRGLALTTERVLRDNAGAGAVVFRAAARKLGIRRWIVCRSFHAETTGHADLYARFLRPGLAAVAWSETCTDDRDVAADLERRLTRARPALRILRVPMRSEGSHYASPLNWVQVGSTLLVPRYPITPPADVDRTVRVLSRAGFRPELIDSPTAEFGGSLHCLTASLYV
jgi:agmatine/peptidylarginine deiminase